MRDNLDHLVTVNYDELKRNLYHYYNNLMVSTTCNTYIKNDLNVI